MVGFPSPLDGSEEDVFDDPDAFVPDHLPSPGPFLASHDLLTGQDHVAIHQTMTDIFEDRGVYDMTFGYNLAKLSLDSRHPDAGFRFAEEAGESEVLRVEFTPTTEFCPQGDTLAKGSFRALNGLSERHEYDLVRVRVAETHQQSDGINEALAEMKEEFKETAEVPEGPEVDGDGDGSGPGMAPGGPAGVAGSRSGDGDAPF